MDVTKLRLSRMFATTERLGAMFFQRFNVNRYPHLVLYLFH